MVIGPCDRFIPVLFLNLSPSSGCFACTDWLKMLTHVASTSLLMIGKSADFCRPRLTGWSMMYWK